MFLKFNQDLFINKSSISEIIIKDLKELKGEFLKLYGFSEESIEELLLMTTEKKYGFILTLSRPDFVSYQEEGQLVLPKIFVPLELIFSSDIKADAFLSLMLEDPSVIVDTSELYFRFLNSIN